LLPAIKLVALTMHVDKNYLTGMLRAGTSAYLLKDCAAEELVTAIRTVVAGKAYLSPEIAPLILEDYSGDTAPGRAQPELSAKEIEVLKLLAQGLGLREIAERLNVSGKTIERCRNQIMEKLDLHSVAQLTKYAVREGISSLT
jgi:DNA-binding NarL/FixJ family response regulator